MTNRNTEPASAKAESGGDPLRSISADAMSVAKVIALYWSWRPRKAVYELLRAFTGKTASGEAFTQERLKLAHAELQKAGLLLEQPHRQGFWRLKDGARAEIYLRLLEEVPAAHLEEMLLQAYPQYRFASISYQHIYDADLATALLCLKLHAGASRVELERLHARLHGFLELDSMLAGICFEYFSPALFERVTEELRLVLAAWACDSACENFAIRFLPCVEWAISKIDDPRFPMSAQLRWSLATVLMLRGEHQRAADLVARDGTGMGDALRAALQVREGRWPEAQSGFEAALKRCQSEFHRRKNVLPVALAWLYPLSLLAQNTPAHLALARKFCKSEAGPESLSTGRRWRTWVHAISVRLGDEPLNPAWFVPNRDDQAALGDFWTCLLRAWMGPDSFDGERVEDDFERHKQRVVILADRLKLCGFIWLREQLIDAERVTNREDPVSVSFLQGQKDGWRQVLASLQALAGEVPVGGEAEVTRILWSLEVDRQGAIEAIEPLEQKRGSRGWSKPKSVVLSRLMKNTKLGPWDAKVARAIRHDGYSSRSYVLDRAAAITALIGHPAVVMADAPEVTVDLVEGTPELEVVRKADAYVLHITPGVRESPAREQGVYYYIDAAAQREDEELRYITVLRDSAQRARVIRLTPAQRRAAQLVAGRFSVPASAQADLQQTLESLTTHFQIQSDHVEPSREVAAESRLRAELSPVGDSLLLRLVVAPLGADGPRLMPGGGRARVMTAIKGESVGTLRDLDAERAALDAVLAAFEFLDPPARGDLVCEWNIEEPENALGLVESLPKLAAILAVEWPRGQPVRVVTIDGSKLTMQVRTEREWFKLQGNARLDEGLVMNLEALLAAASGRSRFVPMGKGVYAALTRELRDKLADLGSVGEFKGDALRLPQLAASWLEDALQGVASDTDKAFVQKVEKLRSAQELQHNLPLALQAELRAYQQEGFVWAMRLAQAGFGAILADDMGLGKTVQTLAVLLARAAGGPALVVAPTSVCGNWLAEARRFAPSLNVLIYGEGERAGVVEAAGAGDLLIVSYTLMQQAKQRFAALTWHTLVADEAQAVKNVAARRTQALLELPADFRLALSGTPIENRLAELWSIMRFCNPGLLGSGERFTEKFATPIERDRDREAQRRLRRLIAPFVMRRTKAQVLDDLPPRTELVLSVVPESAEAAHYEALRRVALVAAESAVQGDQAGRAHLHILAQLTRLRRAACDPRLVSATLGIVGAKVRAFADLASELSVNGHKALVFSQFVDFLTLLRAPLDEAGIRYQYLDGATPAAERSRRVAAFQAGEGDLFLISLKAGGFGLNLTAADYVVITDPWWNPAAEDQAMGRAHRIGQLRPVTVYRLIAKGTLEERIVALHHEKRALAEGLLADDGEGMALPSADELIALMQEE